MGVIIRDHYAIIMLALLLIILILLICVIYTRSLLRRYEELADKDSMTGVYNRVSIERYVDIEISQHPDNNHALLVIDIDNFKRLNDLFGHPFGDKVIEDVAAIIRSNSSEKTKIGRLGGDEFAIFISDYQTIDEVKQFAEDMKSKLHLQYTQLENAFYLTVSIGIAAYQHKEDRFKELYKCADLTLYKAKHAGRDCVAI